MYQEENRKYSMEYFNERINIFCELRNKFQKLTSSSWFLDTAFSDDMDILIPLLSGETEKNEKTAYFIIDDVLTSFRDCEIGTSAFLTAVVHLFSRKKEKRTCPVVLRHITSQMLILKTCNTVILFHFDFAFRHEKKCYSLYTV